MYHALFFSQKYKAVFVIYIIKAVCFWFYLFYVLIGFSFSGPYEISFTHSEVLYVSSMCKIQKTSCLSRYSCDMSKEKGNGSKLRPTKFFP